MEIPAYLNNGRRRWSHWREMGQGNRWRCLDYLLHFHHVQPFVDVHRCYEHSHWPRNLLCRLRHRRHVDFLRLVSASHIGQDVMAFSSLYVYPHRESVMANNIHSIWKYHDRRCGCHDWCRCHQARQWSCRNRPHRYVPWLLSRVQHCLCILCSRSFLRLDGRIGEPQRFHQISLLVAGHWNGFVHHSRAGDLPICRRRCHIPSTGICFTNCSQGCVRPGIAYCEFGYLKILILKLTFVSRSSSLVWSMATSPSNLSTCASSKEQIACTSVTGSPGVRGLALPSACGFWRGSFPLQFQSSAIFWPWLYVFSVFCQIGSLLTLCLDCLVR